MLSAAALASTSSATSFQGSKTVFRPSPKVVPLPNLNFFFSFALVLKTVQNLADWGQVTRFRHRVTAQLELKPPPYSLVCFTFL